MGDAIIGSCHCGELRWSFIGRPESATACNCTICRRYGALWAYDVEEGRIHVAGTGGEYIRGEGAIGFHFCETCGCVGWWRGRKTLGDGRRRIAVNLRLAENPAQVAGVPLVRFDGLDRYEDLPRDGRCVLDLWF